MKYVIITDRGYWGKANTLVDAAKNAKVNAKNCEAAIYRFDPRIVEDVGVSDMGAISWKWTPAAMELTEKAKDALRVAAKLGQYNIRLTKGQLQMTTIGE